MTSAGQALITQFALIVKAAEAVATALQALSTSGGLTPSQQAELAAFAVEFIDRVLNRLFVEYLESRFGQIVIALMATGVIEIVDEPGGPAGSLNGAYTQKTFHFDRAAQMFTKPQDLLSDSFAWGQPSFDGVALFQALQALLQLKFDVPAQLLQPTGMPATLEAFAFSATVDDSLSRRGSTSACVFLVRLRSMRRSIWAIGRRRSTSRQISRRTLPQRSRRCSVWPSTSALATPASLSTCTSPARNGRSLSAAWNGRRSSLQVQSPTADLKLDLNLTRQILA